MTLTDNELTQKPVDKNESIFKVLELFQTQFSSLEVSEKWINYLKLFDKEDLEALKNYAKSHLQFESILNTNLVVALVNEAMYQRYVDEIKFKNRENLSNDTSVSYLDILHLTSVKSDLIYLVNNDGLRTMTYYVRCFDVSFIEKLRDSFYEQDDLTSLQMQRLSTVFNHVIFHKTEDNGVSRSRFNPENKNNNEDK